MKVIINPTLKLIAFLFLFLIEIVYALLVLFIQFLWNFKIDLSYFEYSHLYTNKIDLEDYSLFMNDSNCYSPYFKHRYYKDKYSKIHFRSSFHYLLGCKPYKTDP